MFGHPLGGVLLRPEHLRQLPALSRVQGVAALDPGGELFGSQGAPRLFVGHRAQAPSAAASGSLQAAGRVVLAVSREARRFLGLVHGLAAHHPVEVDLVAVELRTVDADVLRDAVDHHAAAAAHPGAVDHDRVQAKRASERRRAASSSSRTSSSAAGRSRSPGGRRPRSRDGSRSRPSARR